MKTCYKCKVSQAITEFYKDSRSSDGFRYQCRTCCKIYQQSVNGITSRLKYSKTEKSRLRSIRNNKTEAGRRRRKKYDASPKGRAKSCFYASKRRATKLKATPKWLTKDQLDLIEMFYKRAQYLRDVTGIGWDVDHIHPLQGKNSTGLHVPWNLRCIPEEENCWKWNKI